MCGITGVIAFNKKGLKYINYLEDAVQQLRKRGPDRNSRVVHNNIGLGHTHLAIIDLSSKAFQPFYDSTKRYVLVFNGEIFNFKEIKLQLIQKGYQFTSECDTEALLYGFIEWGVQVLNKLNGFFSFAFCDLYEQSIFIVRDRYGVKPLLVYFDNDVLIFASEMKALLAYNIPKEIDNESVFTYLQLNYIPAPKSIFKNVLKILPGTYLYIHKNQTIVDNSISKTLDSTRLDFNENLLSKINIPDTDFKIEQIRYYEIPYSPYQLKDQSYESVQQRLTKILEKSVQQRLISDVALGSFLSGGIDSSIVTILASLHKPNLHTFSMQFKDVPMLDETPFALAVAKKYNTEHTVFSLSTNDILEHIFQILDYIDEPFADSSAIAVNMLSLLTRKDVKVALSGDGGDELFAGYRKHMAEYLMRKNGIKTQAVRLGTPIWTILPKGRHSKIGNYIRQLHRYASGSWLEAPERYWRWASIMDEKDALNLFKHEVSADEYSKYKATFLQYLKSNDDLNELLYTDMKMVLPNDMLFKVDSMSMAHGLEVRTPFLDYNVVNFAFQLPIKYKINSNIQKRILQDAFKNLMPPELYNRPKQGFEVPLHHWFNNELKVLVTNYLLKEDFVREQGIFNYEAIKILLDKLFTKHPEDAPEIIWSLIVFQYWWKKYMNN